MDKSVFLRALRSRQKIMKPLYTPRPWKVITQRTELGSHPNNWLTDRDPGYNPRHNSALLRTIIPLFGFVFVTTTIYQKSSHGHMHILYQAYRYWSWLWTLNWPTNCLQCFSAMVLEPLEVSLLTSARLQVLKGSCPCQMMSMKSPVSMGTRQQTLLSVLPEILKGLGTAQLPPSCGVHGGLMEQEPGRRSFCLHPWRF